MKIRNQVCRKRVHKLERLFNLWMDQAIWLNVKDIYNVRHKRFHEKIKLKLSKFDRKPLSVHLLEVRNLPSTLLLVILWHYTWHCEKYGEEVV